MALIALPQSSSESTLTQAPQALAVNGAYEFKLLSHRISAGFPSPAADYAEEGLDEKVAEKLGMWTARPDLTKWQQMVERVRHPKGEVKIGIVGNEQFL